VSVILENAKGVSIDGLDPTVLVASSVMSHSMLMAGDTTPQAQCCSVWLATRNTVSCRGSGHGRMLDPSEIGLAQWPDQEVSSRNGASIEAAAITLSHRTCRCVTY
jgi:hypothetical protein